MKILIDNGHGSSTPGKRSPDERIREYAYARSIADFAVALWQLPQYLVGAVVALCARAKQVETGEWVARARWFGGAISLTDHFRIYSATMFPSEYTRKHEYGHTRQSRMLGPMYLFVIGIPSIVWAGLHGTKLFPSEKYDYYSFYTERWANKLGGLIV